MLTSSQLRDAYASARCNTNRMARVAFHGWSSPLLVEEHTVFAWELFSAIMKKHDYKFRESAGGTYNCRKISGSSNWSLHAYGIALDLNPSKNPYTSTLITDQPKAFRDDIKRIKTTNGKQVFGWGGDWSGKKDAMHWQVVVTRSDLQTGVSHPNTSVPVEKPPSSGGSSGSSGSSSWPGSLVAKLKTISSSAGTKDRRDTAIVQALLAAHGFVATKTFNSHMQPDGEWGSGTTTAVRNFQKAKGVKVDGIVGQTTWRKLTEGLPTRKKGDGPATSVRVIQGLLAAWDRNMSHSKGGSSFYDGDFGSGTDEDIREFQRLRKIKVDGIVGQDTYTKFFNPAM